MEATKYPVNTRKLAPLCALLVLQMREVQETFIVPLVSAYIPQKDQRSFNNRVLASLGLLNSQVHLVGMRDAGMLVLIMFVKILRVPTPALRLRLFSVKMYPAEEHKFKQQIPSIAQVYTRIHPSAFRNDCGRR
jgi:hypothetical protein